MTDGRPLDEAVARLLGWRQVEAGEPRGRDSRYVKSGYWMPPGERRLKGQRRPPAFSTNMAAAWQILESWDGDCDIHRRNGQWRVELVQPWQQGAAWGETLPLSICLARLAAMEVVVP